MSSEPDDNQAETKPSATATEPQRINATIGNSTLDKSPDIIIPRAGLSEVASGLAGAFRKGLLDHFSRPPEITTLKDLLSKLPTDMAASARIIDLFGVHQFNATDEQIRLLTSYDFSLAKPSQQVDLHYAMSCIYRNKKEYSLAVDHIDCALKLSMQIGLSAEEIAPKMLVRGLCLAQSDDTRTDEYHREIVTYCTKFNLRQYLSPVYKNWSSYLWRRRKHQDALLILEREVEVSKSQGLPFYLRSICWFASRHELLDRQKTISICQEIIHILEIRHQDIDETLRADVHYEIACMFRRNTDNHELVAKHARIAYELFIKWIGHEVRAAWCASLLSAAYHDLGNLTEATYFREERDRLTKRSGGAREAFLRLAETVLRGESQEDDLKNLEALVILTADELMTLRWYSLLALDKLLRGNPSETISIGKYALTLVDEQEFKQKYNPTEIANIHRTIAEGYLAVGDKIQYLQHLKKAVELVPSNNHNRWILCNNALNIGNISIAEEQAAFLQKHAPSIGSYRVHARCQIVNGNIDAALETLDQARNKFPSHQDVNGEYKELSEIKLGLQKINDSKHFNKLPAVNGSGVALARVLDETGLPEYEKLNSFRKSVIDTIVRYIYMEFKRARLNLSLSTRRLRLSKTLKNQTFAMSASAYVSNFGGTWGRKRDTAMVARI